mgnify:CR=1 FL=1
MLSRRLFLALACSAADRAANLPGLPGLSRLTASRGAGAGADHGVQDPVLGGGLGLGLTGAKRLVDDFELESTVGVGTRITIARWGSSGVWLRGRRA